MVGWWEVDRDGEGDEQLVAVASDIRRGHQDTRGLDPVCRNDL